MPSDGKIENDLVNLVTRLEVIDETGRAYVNTSIESVELHLQDDTQTLKVFVVSNSEKQTFASDSR